MSEQKGFHIHKDHLYKNATPQAKPRDFYVMWTCLHEPSPADQESIKQYIRNQLIDRYMLAGKDLSEATRLAESHRIHMDTSPIFRFDWGSDPLNEATALSILRLLYAHAELDISSIRAMEDISEMAPENPLPPLDEMTAVLVMNSANWTPYTVLRDLWLNDRPGPFMAPDEYVKKIKFDIIGFQRIDADSPPTFYIPGTP